MRIKRFRELYESTFDIDRDEINLIMIKPVTCTLNIDWGTTVPRSKFLTACRKNNVEYTELKDGPEHDQLEGIFADVLNVMSPYDDDNGWSLGYVITFEKDLTPAELKLLDKYMVARGLSDFVDGYKDQLDFYN